MNPIDTSLPVTPEPGMRVLVLGGGFVCSHLAKCLTAAGIDVTVFSRSFSSLVTDSQDAITLIKGEICGNESLPELIAQHDVVVHGAASSTPALAREDAPAALTTTLLPVATVLSIMRDQGGGRIVLLSSGGTVYGNPDQFPTPENHPLRPVSEHGVNFALAEQLLAFYGRTHGVEGQTLRLANVYGPGQMADKALGVLAHWLRAIAEGEAVPVIGSIEVARDFVFVEDAARAVVAAIVNGAWPATYNIGSAHTHTLAEVMDRVRSIVGREFAIDVKPARSVDLPKTHLDISLINKDTGWRPTTSLESGIRQTWHSLAGESGEAAASAAAINRDQLRHDPAPIPAT